MAGDLRTAVIKHTLRMASIEGQGCEGVGEGAGAAPRPERVSLNGRLPPDGRLPAPM